jgi:hypothetical protein
LVKDVEAFNRLTTEKPWLDIVAMNSRGKTNKRKVTADKPDINAVTESVVVQEVKLSDETEAYLKRKEELIGKDNLDRIHKQVWGEDEEAEAELRANPF